MTANLSLPKGWQDVVAVSREQRMRAYAPYSGFVVGAAVQSVDGSIIGGCNVENSSYGLTICAERNAVTSAIAAGQRSIELVCISLTGTAVPCGACRQFLHEFNPKMKVVLDDLSAPSGQPPEVIWLGELLPRAFRLDPTADHAPKSPTEPS